MVRATVSGNPLKASQARYLLRLTGRPWTEHPTPPTREEAKELLDLLVGALHDAANNDKLTVAVERTQLWYPDFGRGDVRRHSEGKARAGQGTRRAKRAAPKPTAPVEFRTEVQDYSCPEHEGEAYLLAAQERLSQLNRE
jgi:hypothetical protein